MQNNTIFLYISVFLTLLSAESSASVLADSSWTLERCIETAQRNNLQVKKKEQEVENSHLTIQQAKGNFTPNVSANGSNNWNFGRSIDPFSNQFTNTSILAQNYSLNSSWILFQGFQNQHNLRYSTTEWRAVNEDLNTIKENVGLEVTGIFMDILYFKEEVKVRRSTIQTTRELTNRTARMVESGTKRQADLVSLQAQLADEERMLIEAENNTLLRKTDLALYLNLEQIEGFDISAPEIITIDTTWQADSPDVLYNKTKDNRPVMRALKYRTASQYQFLNVQRGKYYPRLTFNAGLSTIYSSSSKVFEGSTITGQQQIGFLPDNTPVYAPVIQTSFVNKPYHLQVSDNFSQYVGFTLFVPILNNLTTKTAVARSKVNLKTLEYQTQEAQQQVRKDVVNAYTRCTNAQRKLTAAKTALDLQQLNLNYAERNLTSGLSTSVDYTQAKWRYENAQSEYLKARYEVLFRSKILDFYRGIPITL